tara:strand:+ start:437 stop:1009 length:573 start_codon:yes stop_codon:yes gene_type:complete
VNELEFVASMTGSLAWPLAATIIAFAFRGQIKSVFNRLDEFGFGEWRLKLRRDLKEAEQVAEALPPPPQLPVIEFQTSSRSDENRFEDLLMISPSAAILDSWRTIEDRLMAMAERLHLNDDRPLPIHKVIEEIGKNRLFPSSLVSLLHELRQIRNSAAHSSEVTPEDALRFKRLSDRVTPFLRPDLFNQN